MMGGDAAGADRLTLVPALCVAQPALRAIRAVEAMSVTILR